MRITSEGPGSRLGACTIPVPARLGQAYQSWGYVEGSPGTDPIPAPCPAGVPQGIRYQLTGSPRSTSKDAPPVWTPGIYFQPVPPSRFPGATESDNQMPIPAVSQNSRGAFLSRRPQLLRQQQVGWPVTTPAYAWRP